MGAIVRSWWAALALAGLSGGCASKVSQPAAPPPEPVTATPAPGSFAPGAAAGTYQLRTAIQGRTDRSGQRQGQRRRAATEQATTLRLDGTPLAAPDPDAASPTQFTATIAIPGYTQAPRGRSGQAASWWPIPGDSLVIQFRSRNEASIQLRGELRGREIRGEVWFVSIRSGATFQLGTFSATRSR